MIIYCSLRLTLKMCQEIDDTIKPIIVLKKELNIKVTITQLEYWAFIRNVIAWPRLTRKVAMKWVVVVVFVCWRWKWRLLTFLFIDVCVSKEDVNRQVQLFKEVLCWTLDGNSLWNRSEMLSTVYLRDKINIRRNLSKKESYNTDTLSRFCQLSPFLHVSFSSFGGTGTTNFFHFSGFRVTQFPLEFPVWTVVVIVRRHTLSLVAPWLAYLAIVAVITGSILAEVGGFFRVGEKPQVLLPSVEK